MKNRGRSRRIFTVAALLIALFVLWRAFSLVPAAKAAPPQQPPPRRLKGKIAGIDIIYCIALLPHRRARMAAISEAVGLKIEFADVFSAHDVESGQLLLGTHFDRARQSEDIHRVGWKAVACWQSHLRLLHRIASSNATALVLEDDVDFDVDFVQKIETILSVHVPRGWHMLRLGGCFEQQDGAVVSAELPGGAVLRASSSYACTHAYVVRGTEGARRIIEQIDVPSLTCGFDVWMSVTMNRRSSGWRSYSVFPPIVNQLRAGKEMRTKPGMPPLANSTTRMLGESFFLLE